jgi:hypothetical protein
MLYQSLYQLLNLISEPNRTACINLFKENKSRFEIAPGSFTKHQAWHGGYLAHLEETMNFGVNLFNMMNDFRELDFDLSDVIFILFLHDLEKPFRYIEPKIEFNSDEEKELFIESMIKRYNIVLNENHKNALKYIHGEGKDFSRTERIQKPLATFVHICDVASARIWHDYPGRG